MTLVRSVTRSQSEHFLVDAVICSTCSICTLHTTARQQGSISTVVCVAYSSCINVMCHAGALLKLQALEVAYYHYFDVVDVQLQKIS
jgi:hypothetical protein